MNIRISIVFYFGIHVLVAKSNLISRDDDNPAPTHNDPKTSSQTVDRITGQDDTDFRAAVLEGKLVIDKTRFIPKLLKKGDRQSIMLRPYRFGKSFFLSTLEAFFEGDKDLFCSPLRPKMDICYNSDSTWWKYPILSLNFAELDGQPLSDYIIQQVRELARLWGVDCDEKMRGMSNVIHHTFSEINRKEKKGIVILVDEYDLPVMQTYFTNVDSSKWNEGVIQSFFSSLKKRSSLIHFAFIFGATHVTTIGQTLNLLEDLTRNETYSDLIGFTEEEIMKTYKERLEEIASERKKSIVMLFEETLRPYYNSYRFSVSGISVFNPLSISKFLIENPIDPKPYWAEKVHSRDFLKHTVKKFSNYTINLLSGKNHSVESLERLNEKLDRDSIMLGDTTELAKILYQTGHMTMQEPVAGSSSSYCDLRVVNEEAKYLFQRCLQEKVNEGPLSQMDTMLQEYKFEEFIKALEDAMVHFMGDEYFKIEVKYELIVSILLELRSQAPTDWKAAVMTSARMKQIRIEGKVSDYVKTMPLNEMTIIFYLKRYETGRIVPNTTFELMKCHSAYVKPYAKKNPERKVMCIVLVFYTEADQAARVRDQRIQDTNFRFIMNWAVLEWFQEEKEVQEHNIHPALNDEQREEVAAYNDKDQQKTKQDLTVPKEKPVGQVYEVSKHLEKTAAIFNDKKLLTFEQFTQLIEGCKYPDKDGVRIVEEFTHDRKGVIKLIDECYALVENRWLRLRLTKIKKALQN